MYFTAVFLIERQRRSGGGVNLGYGIIMGSFALCKAITVKSVITIAQVQEYGKENTLHLRQRYSISLGCFGGDKTEYGAYDDT